MGGLLSWKKSSLIQVGHSSCLSENLTSEHSAGEPLKTETTHQQSANNMITLTIFTTVLLHLEALLKHQL